LFDHKTPDRLIASTYMNREQIINGALPTFDNLPAIKVRQN